MTAMFIRSVKAKDKKGQTHEYLRLVEGYRENGQNKQRLVLTLGRKDHLAPHLDSLVRFLQDQNTQDPWIKASQVFPTSSACYGPVMAARAIWVGFGLDDILDQYHPSLADRVFALVANRLSSPGSEHHLASWLETDYVCDREGRRFLPAWEQHGRVQVNSGWIQQWYRTLDRLVAHKEEIERDLFFRLRDLFALEVELVFYDLTSTYFEGEGPEIAKYGYSRDGKKRNRQVEVGVVMVNGWPIAHHVFPGNLADSQTVQGVIDDLEKRFGLKRVVFVGDRGMVSSANLAMLRERRHGYLWGLKRRRQEGIYQFVQRATGPWQECDEHTRVQEVSGDEPGVRVFVVESDERLAYESAMRQRAMERTAAELERLTTRVADGRLKAPEKIGAAAARILSRHHGDRYYGWEIKEGRFRYFEHPNLEREKAYEGKYLIQTEERDLSPIAAVAAYKELSEVERAFRSLKDVIELRPIYHRTDDRVKGHIFVAALAFLLKVALGKRLKEKGSSLSSDAALEALRTISVVELDAGGETKRGLTSGSNRAREVVKALGINPSLP